MDNLKMRLWLCDILIILNFIAGIGGVLILLTISGVIPIEVAKVITTIILLKPPAWVTFTVGECVILGLIFMIWGFNNIEKFVDERRSILEEIAGDATQNKDTP